MCLKWSLYFTVCLILLPKPLLLEPFGNLAAVCKAIMSVLCMDLSAGGNGGVSGVFCLDHSVLPSILNKTTVLHRVLVLRQEAMEQSIVAHTNHWYSSPWLHLLRVGCVASAC